MPKVHTLMMSTVQRILLIASLTASAALVTGCAMSAGSQMSSEQTGSTSTTGNGQSSVRSGLGGSVHGGQQPIAAATVTLWSAGTTGATAASYGANATQIATTTTGPDGSFTFNNQTTGASPCTVGQYLYITSTGGQVSGTQVNTSAALMAALPQPCSTTGPTPTAQQFVNLNEETTVAAVWSLQQFMKISPGSPVPWQIGAPAANNTGLANAFLMSSSLVNLTTGVSSPSTITNTVGGVLYSTVVTPDYLKINTLADILAACINTISPSAVCSNLFTDTTPASSAAPTDTIQAAYYLATNPGGLTMPNHGTAAGSPSYLCSTYPTGTSPFQSTLNCANTYDWTINVSWQTTNPSAQVTGTLDAASVAIDGYGNVWIGGGNGYTNGAVTEFNPLGQPIIAPVNSVNIPTFTLKDVIANAATSYTVPASSNVALTYGQPFSLAVDTAGNAWFGSYNALTTTTGKLTSGSNSFFGGLVTEVSPSGAATGYLAGFQPSALAIDGANNIYLSDSPTNNKFFFSELTAGSSPAFQTINEGYGRVSGGYAQAEVDGLGYAYSFYTPTCTNTTTLRVNSTNEAGAPATPANPPGNNLAVVLASQCASYGAPDNIGNLWVTAKGALSYINITGNGATLTSPIVTNITGSTNTVVTNPGGVAGLDLPQGVAIDGAGNVWAANRVGATTAGANGISELTPSTSGTTTTVTALSPSAAGVFGFGSANGWTGVNGVAIDPSGNVWVMTTAGNTLNYLVGAAAPVITPLAQQAGLNSIGVLAGTVASTAPGLNLSASQLGFNTVTTGTSSSPMSVTLTNTGTASLSLSTFTITGTNAGLFTKTTTCGTVLAAGSNCSVSVTFSPNTPGNLSATLNLPNGISSSQAVPLSGVGGAPVLTLSSSALVFSGVSSGNSLSQQLTLTNAGTAQMTLSSFSITGTNPGYFGDTTTCGTNLAINASCTVTVTYTAPDSGSYSAILNIPNNAFSGQQSVLLSSSDTPAMISISPAPLTITSTSAGSSNTGTVTLSNTGAQTLTLSAMSITGTSAPFFTVSSTTCGTSLVANASCTVTIKFSPLAVGSQSATLNVPNNSTGAQSVNLSSTGLGAPVTLVQNSSTDWQINNGAMVVDYDPAGMNIWSVVLNGQQLVDTTSFSSDGHYAGLYMDNVGLTASGCIPGNIHVPASGSIPEYVDLWTTCPSGTSNPATYSLHYVIVSSDPGFHTYFTVNHSSTDIAGSLGQIQWVFRDNYNLLTSTYEYNPGLNMPGEYIVPLPTNADINTSDPGRAVSNAVTDLHGFTDLPSGYFRGFYTKYDYAGYEYMHQAHGLYGSQYGVWGVFPSLETFTGGPTKQNLDLTASLLTIDASDSHFLPSIGVNLLSGTALSRLWGPYYIRFNQFGRSYTASGTALATPNDLYNDAVSAGSGWGNFYNNETTLISSGYVPTTAAARGSVSIQVNNIVGMGSTSTQYAWAVLSDNATNFQLSMNGMQYWADISSSGSATFTNVVPGTYRLSVYVLGQYGELRVDNITVTAGNATVLPVQTFVPENFGTTIFALGVPDRSSHEFMHGLDANGHDLKMYWGTYNYWADFANTQGAAIYYGTAVGSTPASNNTALWPATAWGKNGFDPGLFGGYFCNNSSDDTTDGYTCVIPSYVASLSGAKGTNGVTTGTPAPVIHFATPANFASNQYVTLSASLACSDGTFIVSLNGNSSYSYSEPGGVETDCMLRSGFSGFTQTVVYQFPVSELNQTVGGDNTLSVSSSGTGNSFDALRLELSNTNAIPTNTGWYDYTLLNAPGSVIPANDAVPNP